MNRQISTTDIDYVLFRLENDYPAGYDYKVLRLAAEVIRELQKENNDE